jgi:hypothetical protein
LFPDDPTDPRFEIRIEAADPGSDAVYAMPGAEAVFGEVRLGEEWLAEAERSGRRFDIDGHFILAYRDFDERGRPIEVDALRLLPTAWSPMIAPPNSPEYASCPATITWSNGDPEIHWDQEVLEAAATWVARFDAETSEAAGCD